MAFKDWYCEMCSLQFDKKIIFIMHLSIVHKEVVGIKEEPTSNNFKEEPEKTRIKTLLQCEICSKTFSHKSAIKYHITSVHEEKKPFKCKMCDHSYSEKGNLKRHISSVHEKKKPFKCETCDYTSSQKVGLKRHITSIHEKIRPYQCVICDKTFNRKVHMASHVSRIHEENLS